MIILDIPGSSAGWKSSPNAFRLKFQPESCKPQIFARMDFGYFGHIQQDRCLEWIDNQSLDCHRDEQHIFELGGSQMGNNDVPGYVALVFRFFSPEWCEILPFWCLISPEVKSTKLPKNVLEAVNQIFCSQHRSLASWGKKQKTVPIEKITIDVDTLFIHWRFSPELGFQPAGWNISPNEEKADLLLQAEITAFWKI